MTVRQMLTPLKLRKEVKESGACWPPRFARSGRVIIRSMLTPFFQYIAQDFGSLVVKKPLMWNYNDRKTKIHESDQTIIAVTRAGQGHKIYCQVLGDKQEWVFRSKVYNWFRSKVYNRFLSKVYNLLGVIFPEKGFWAGCGSTIKRWHSVTKCTTDSGAKCTTFLDVIFPGKWVWPGAVALSNGDIPSHSVQLIPV